MSNLETSRVANEVGRGVNYTYDGDGRRAKKSSGKLYWYGIGAEPLAESDLSGNVSEEYIFFGWKRIARRVVSTSTVFYYFADHLGTSRVMVQATQTTACYEADYTPYGKERVIINTCPQNYKFTGKERDSESSLDYFGARFYSWTLGRFHSPDLPFIDQKPWNPQSWNLYAYVQNNPLKFVDPSGNYLQPYGASPNDMLPNVNGWSFIGGNQMWTIAMSTVPQAVGGESSETTTTSADVQQATGTQNQQTGPKLGIGIEVPAQAAVENNVLDVSVDSGHTFAYVRNASGEVVSILSFGPGEPIGTSNKGEFQAGNLSGNAHWPLQGNATTWEFSITATQMTAALRAMDAVRENVPNYTPTRQCTSAALSIATAAGVNLPRGIGPVRATALGVTVWSGRAANPYHLNQQMHARYGPPRVVNTSIFPTP